MGFHHPLFSDIFHNRPTDLATRASHRGNSNSCLDFIRQALPSRQNHDATYICIQAHFQHGYHTPLHPPGKRDKNWRQGKQNGGTP
ncbi:hypothetical protein J6590_073763 [Homalodisca vitripennis]|nr:hypothetical protein J6590_073763 [Homalodisca vitripennis]